MCLALCWGIEGNLSESSMHLLCFTVILKALDVGARYSVLICIALVTLCFFAPAADFH